MGVSQEMKTTGAEGWDRELQQPCQRFQLLGRQSSFEVSCGGSRGEGGGESGGVAGVRGEGTPTPKPLTPKNLNPRPLGRGVDNVVIK